MFTVQNESWSLSPHTLEVFRTLRQARRYAHKYAKTHGYYGLSIKMAICSDS